MVKNTDENFLKYQATQFRVALLLKQYKFGAASTAKFLGKTRGEVQSWMQNGSDHYLAKMNITLKNYEKIVKKLRKKITKENLDYFLTKRLLDMDLPVAFVSKTLGLPTSTVRSWHYGKVPNEIKKFFYDPKLVDKEFNKLLRSLKTETTIHNLEYFLALRLSKEARSNIGAGRIGGRVISKILSNHFNLIKQIPEKTISCWITDKRKPWDAFEDLMDDRVINREYCKIINELTFDHKFYHISMALAKQYNWSYNEIGKVLELNKEVVRGWVKKGRGSPVAKAFVNNDIIKTELRTYLEKPKEKVRSVEALQTTFEHELDEELEQELIYHLETFPAGVTSAKVLQSILIDHQNASVEDIEKVLKYSKQIIQSAGKWILKRYFEELAKPVEIYDEETVSVE